MSELQDRCVEITKEYWACREGGGDSERIATAQLILALARTELELRDAREIAEALFEAGDDLSAFSDKDSAVSKSWRGAAARFREHQP